MSGTDISEANARIPRRVRFNDDIITILSFTLLFFVLWLVPAAWGTYDDFRDSHIRDILLREGHEAKGEVIKSYTGRGGVDVEYRFSVGGVLYSNRARMIADAYRVQAPGEKITIRYLPKDPRINQPINWQWFSVGWVVFDLFGLGLLVVVGVCIIAGFRERKLSRMGVVVEGRVTGCVSDRKLFKVYYEFTTQDNVSLEGTAELPEEREAGTAIPVIYLRSNPKRNDCYQE